MYKEQYTPLYTGAIHLKPGEAHEMTFDGTGCTGADRLFFTGETALFYQWKDEPDYPVLYRRIDDALNTAEAERAQYALDLSGNGDDFPRVAYHRLSFPPVLSYLGLVGYGDVWQMGISVRAEGLSIDAGGYLRFVCEVRYRRDGVDKNDTRAAPDELFTIDIPSGDYPFRRLEKTVQFDARRAASVAFVLEGERYRGRVFCEAPAFLSENGYNILPDFAPYAAERPQFTWIGQNLSRKEWPSFEVTLNGQCLHRGEIFERCHRQSEWEVTIPAGAVRAGENMLAVRLLSDYRDALAYDIGEIGLIDHGDGFVVAVPEIVTAGRPFAALVRGGGATALSSDDGRVRALSLSPAAGDGLRTVSLICDAPGADIRFRLTRGDVTEECAVERCVRRADDGVVTGSSDIIYVRQDRRDFEDFLSFYFAHHLGNLLTVRQTYRWAGTRALNADLFRDTARLLNDAGVAYAHMLDGRELPGIDQNPSPDMLAGPGFLGRQKHERDGAVSYWGVNDLTGQKLTEMWYDLWARMARRRGAYMTYAQDDQVFRGGKHWLYRDMSLPDDMEIVAKDSVRQLAATRGDATRHTGPSTLFKYFYQAGYRFTGAETMYGPHEILAAAIRGAAALYGGKTGAHLAVQWSTTPHDTPGRYRRYRLALYVPYIQGIDEINTEEGFLHLEEYYAHFHRFSDACRAHTAEQAAFYRYVASHARTGAFRTPIAFLSGRYDGWTCFVRAHVWGRPSFGFGDPEKAWDILRYFYPRSVQDALYRHGCPEDRSVGFYSGTPQGNVDIVPIEGEDFSRYRLLVAPGYNKAMAEDMDKFDAYVRAGGTLILGWPQLSVTTARADVLSGAHRYIDHPFRAAVCGEADFRPDSYEGQPLSLSHHACAAPVLLRADSGAPLVYDIAHGRGHILFVNAREYAGCAAVGAVYGALLARAVPAVTADERVFARGTEDVQFTVYEQADGSTHLYFLATDWFRPDDVPRRGELLLDGRAYPLDIPFGVPVRAVAADGAAVWPDGSCAADCEVLSLAGGIACVQGIGRAVFHVAQGGTVRTVAVDFANGPVQEFAV